jgi:HEAT repeat protein
MRRQSIAAMLKGGDRRSIGKANQIAKLLSSDPQRFAELFKCLWDEDPIVRMRAADAAEKVTFTRPELLNPHKREMLGLLAEAKQIELRWHLALMVPRLALSGPERERASAALQHYLEDRSSIVKTFALQGLADLARQDSGLREPVRRTLEESLRTGTPAMKARARKLLKELQNEPV